MFPKARGTGSIPGQGTNPCVATCHTVQAKNFKVNK